MLARQGRQQVARSFRRRSRLLATGAHARHQDIASLFVKATGPATGALVNGRELLVGEDLQPLTGTFQALGQILFGFAFAVGQQFDGVIALFALSDILQAHHHFRLAKQEDV